MPRIVVGDVEIYWESQGQGEPVLIITGVGGGTWSYEDAINAWSPHHRVIVFDNIGAGLSDMPDRPYRIEEMADHAAAILDTAGETGAHVMGFSMGGMIAQELALGHPDRVQSLVLGCTHCGGEKRVPPPAEVIAKFANNEGLSPEEIVDKNLALLVTPEFVWRGGDGLKRYKKRQLEAPLQPDYALQRQLEAIRSFDVCERVNNIRMPTLILTGEDDTLVPPENGHLLASLIKGAVLHSFPRTGHLIYLECAQEFHDTVLAFFHEHSASQAMAKD